MQETVTRPTAQKRKIHSKNEFELCYLRHQYLRRVDYNPDEKEMAPYIAIVKHCANNTFAMYRNLFFSVGFERDDLINIGKVHLISFLGLFSLEKMENKYVDFMEVYEHKNNKLPDEFAMLSKNRANFTMFLKQRMEDVVRICRQKTRNIRGLPTEEYYAYNGPNPPPAERRELLENYAQFGFRKMDIAVFKSIRKKVRTLDKNLFQFNNTWYVAVQLDHRALAFADLAGAGLDPHDSLHNLNPEQVLYNKEQDALWRRRKKNFARKPKDMKIKMISDFVEKNKDNGRYKEELIIAQKYLKNAGV
jgi:hypothetical protein